MHSVTLYFAAALFATCVVISRCSSSSKTCAAEGGSCAEGLTVFEHLPSPFVPPITAPVSTCGSSLRIVRLGGDNHFLPDPSTLQPCPERQRFTEGFLERLKQLQFPEECRDTEVIDYEEDIAGMSSTMLSFALDILDSSARNKTFTYHGPAWYSQTVACEGEHTYQCWFRQWGSCVSTPKSRKIISCSDDEARPPMTQAEMEKEGLGSAVRSPLPLHKFGNRVCAGVATPEQFDQEDYWAGTTALQYVMHPNQKVAAKVSHLKKAMGFKGPTIGMHVRHSDSCWESGRATEGFCCPRFSEYMKDAQKLQDKYGVKEIFLATDNQHIIDHQLANYPNFTIHHLDIDRYLPPTEWTDVYMQKLFESKKVGLQGDGIVLDMLLLAECDFMVGHADSAVSRTAHYLMSANKQYTAPYILKLPIPWESMGCANCTWWLSKVREFNSNQLDEAEEICEVTCDSLRKKEKAASEAKATAEIDERAAEEDAAEDAKEEKGGEDEEAEKVRLLEKELEHKMVEARQPAESQAEPPLESGDEKQHHDGPDSSLLPQGFPEDVFRNLHQFWKRRNYNEVAVLRQGLPGLVAYALHSFGQEIPREGPSPVLRVHLIGGSDDDEARGAWEILERFLPAWGQIRISIVGPHVLTGREPCGTCTRYPDKPDAKLVVECYQGLYQDWLSVKQKRGRPLAQPDAAFLLNCGIAGEIEDFAPTIFHLRDKGILTFVSNYWYEPMDDIHHFYDSKKVTVHKHFWAPAGNQNEMWDNVEALSVLGVAFKAQYQRNPFPMLFGPLKLPPGVGPKGQSYQPMKNGYFHVFQGGAGKAETSENYECEVAEQQLFTLSLHKRLKPGCKVRVKEALAHKQDKAANACSEISAALRKCLSGLGSSVDSEAANAAFEQYEQEQEEQEEQFQESCD